MPTEPSLEDLSAYLDDRLSPAERATVEPHLETCADCRAKVDGLRQAVNAVRALPMETPSRAFTVPAQRRQAEPFRWAPVGWLGSAAAAVLVIALGVSQLHWIGNGNTTAMTASNSVAGGTAGSSGNAQYFRSTAPEGQKSNNDAQALAARPAYGNPAAVADPQNPARTLTVSTDAATYTTAATLTVRVQLTGLGANDGTTVRLLLERNGYAVELTTPAHVSGGFDAGYALSSLPLSNPVGGSYTLIAIEQLPGGNGATLVARLPLTISG